MEDISWFRKSGFNLCDEFYNQVIAVFKAHSTEIKRSFTEFVYDEFVLNDMVLTTDKTKSGRLDITDKICSSVKNSLILQVNDVIDVSKPYMSASKKSIRRLLKLKLTNGIGVVYAFECGRYPLPFELGCMKYEKILIKNGADIRRGFLLLSEENCFKLLPKSTYSFLLNNATADTFITAKKEFDKEASATKIHTNSSNSNVVIDLT